MFKFIQKCPKVIKIFFRVTREQIGTPLSQPFLFLLMFPRNVLLLLNCCLETLTGDSRSCKIKSHDFCLTTFLVLAA